MVIVRESPRSARSPDTNEHQWPPKSPFEALMSSPGGRRRWQNTASQRQERTPSPSPLRKPFASPSARNAKQGAVDFSDGEDDEDEDEEIAQLRLAEIQAKLRIKELQKKARKAAQDQSKREGSPASTVPAISQTHSLKPNVSSIRQRTAVQVPLSPTRVPEVLKDPLSPARRKLGLQDVRRAEDVSLKRPRDIARQSRANGRQAATNNANGQPAENARPLTFSERLAASRNVADQADARKERIEQARSKGFDRDATTFAQTSTMIERRTTRPSIFDSDGMTRPSSAHASTTHAQNDTFEKPTRESHQTSTKPRPETHAPTSLGQTSDRIPIPVPPQSQSQTEGKSGNFEPFSEIHLSKRQIAHPVVAREMENREIYTLPRLLKEVKSPEYEPPDCEKDFVVFAILASKSSPYNQKAAARTSTENDPQDDPVAPRNKFMVFKLCDLKWEVDCFLFGTAFDQFWKLTPGTLLAILNPGIMPPRNNSANGRFSLKLGSSEDCVMEIGIARDLSYCESVKSDGQKCTDWVDKRKAQLCEFHLNLQIDRGLKSRMEVNTMFRRGGGKTQDNERERRRIRKDYDPKAKPKFNPNLSISSEYGRVYSIPSSMRGSTAKMLDHEDTDALHNMTREEASRKRLAAAQKERDLVKKLGEMGNGMGAEYLRASQVSQQPQGSFSLSSSSSSKTSVNPHDKARSLSPSSSAKLSQGLFDKPKIADLGLLGNKAAEIHLSPAKDRKRHFGLGMAGKTTTAGGAEAMGWGGAKKAGLLQPRESRLGSPEKGQTRLDSAMKPRANLIRGRSSDGSLSPKKRARFALEKGIREPGRESLGGDDLQALANKSAPNDDDDDDLDIV